MDKILFYRTVGEYGCFTNFSKHSVIFNGLIYPTSEHAFQAQKFVNNPDIMEKIRLLPTPKEAAIMGRDRSLPLRPDWDSYSEEDARSIFDISLVKDFVMLNVVLAKFNQHPDIKQTLINTEKSTIVEASPIDYYWGCGKDYSGKNMLGKILMIVRDRINYENSLVTT